MKLYHIGRSKENEIRINHESVSRKHAQLSQEDGALFLIDLNSTNGTFVNGKQIAGKHLLRAGDSVRLGEALFEWEEYRNSFAASSEEDYDQEEIEDLGDRETPKKRWKSTVLGNGKGVYLLIGGIGLLLIIILFLALGGKDGESLKAIEAENLVGRWENLEDQKAWLEFGEGGTYEEGYGKQTIYKDAEYEIRDGKHIMVRKGNIAVLYPYDLEGDELTLTMNAGEEKYARK